MLIGHEEIGNSFKKLAKDGALAHGYLFFGEPQVGKFLFAKHLAGLLERGAFEIVSDVMTETLIVKPEIKESGEKSIGIEAVRDLKQFLYSRPVNSKYRMAIVDDVQYMTDIAQNALLKIAEEPPEHAILIIIAANSDVLLKTVQSRFQKVYFARVESEAIKKMLESNYGIGSKEATELARLAFGRPGRAIDLAQDEKLKEIAAEAKSFAARTLTMKSVMTELADIENRDKIEPFLTELIAELAQDVRKNYAPLRELIHRHHMLNEWNTNKRIQLEAGLGPAAKNI